MATIYNNKNQWLDDSAILRQSNVQQQTAANNALAKQQQAAASAVKAATPAATAAQKPATTTPAAQTPNYGGMNTAYGYTPSQAVLQAQQMLNDTINNKPGAYVSRYGDQLQGLLDQITNRDPFAYDLNADPLWQIYKDQYMMGGKRAMQDTMGQAAALTGGYGNSYAQSVGQQMYNQWMENLYGMVPELQQQAYQRYADEGDRLAQNYQLLNQAENQDYGRYRDIYGDWETERQMRENTFNDERNFDYGSFGDKRSYDMSVDQFNQQMALQNAQLALQREQFEWQKAQAAAKASGSGGSGGRSGSSKSSGNAGSAGSTAQAATASNETKQNAKPLVYKQSDEYGIMDPRTYAQIDPLQKMYTEMTYSPLLEKMPNTQTATKRYKNYAENAIMNMHQNGQISDQKAIELANLVKAYTKPASPLFDKKR